MELLISTARLVGNTNKRRKSVAMRTLKYLDHVPFTVSSPAGFSDVRDDWMGGEALLRRIEWAALISRAIDIEHSVHDMAKYSLYPVIRRSTYRAIAEANDDRTALAILIGSPEFQRR